MDTPEDSTSDWREAGLEAVYQWHQFAKAGSILEQAGALVKLSNAMHDMSTFLPGYEWESGTMPWERGEDG